MSNMKLGIQLGYWGAQPPTNIIEVAQQAEQLGFDSVWTAEAWGSDAFTPLAWIGAHTQKVRLGTAVVQLSARTPTATAMAALTLDHLSKGRMILGLGVSGPQVVEGWYGQPFSKPLSRTREYIDIIRQVLAREAPVTSDGPHYPLPYKGEGSCMIDDLEQALAPVKAMLGFYIGGMGAKSRNFHMELMCRMGYEQEAHKIQELFLDGKRAEAIAAVPDAFADEISLCGPKDRIKDRLEAWKASPVTSLLLANQDIDLMRTMAELVL